MTSRGQSQKSRQQQNTRETLCERMAGFLKALGLENKPEYTEKIPETLTDRDFSIHDTFHHGFPSQPSCLAYDAVQKILAIATKHGTVVLLGKPGLEGSFTHPETCSISQMEFIANKNLLITCCENRTLYQWSVAEKQPQIRHQLQFTKECPTTMSWTYGSEWLYVGSDASNVHLVHVDNFTLSGYVIHWNSIVDGHHKMRPGDVMTVKEHPMDQGKILIAFSSSLLVLWNVKNKCCDKRYTHDPGINHVLTSVSWLGSGKLFSSAYSDGTLAIWNPKVDNKPEKVLCLHESDAEARVSKIIYKLHIQMTESDTWYICSGGYPEESHCSPRTITVRHGKSLTLLSTNSTIIDFISLPSSPFSMDPQKPLALVILTKDELVVHDLQTESFPLFSLPHALDIHVPPVSCLEFYGNCPEELIASLHSVKSKMLHKFNSSRLWPLMGGKWGHESPYLPTDVILTGHTDGSVRLWYCSSVIFQPFFTLPTALFFKYNCTPFSYHSNTPSPTTKHAKSPPPPSSQPNSLTPQHHSVALSHDDQRIPPPRPPPPSISKAASTSRLHAVEEHAASESMTEGTGGALRQVRSSEQFAVLRKVSEGSEGGGEGEGEEEEELERLKTPSPATGQLRVDGEEGTDGQLLRMEPSVSPSTSRKTIFSREKKSFFKRHSKSRFNPLESPRLSPRHLPDNISEVSDDRSESPLPEEKEKKSKHKKKLQSFRKVAMKVKIGKKMISKGSSSEEKEDTDAGSVGPSEGGEEEREGEEGGEREMTTAPEEGSVETDGAGHTSRAGGSPAPQRPDSLRPQSESGEGGVGGGRKTKLKKGSKSFRQDKKMPILPSETPQKTTVRSFERRTSAPGNFRVMQSQPTPVLGNSIKILGNGDHSDAPLTPIVEISPPNAASDSVFSAEEDVFAVQRIKCCVLGQWMCVSNAGGHVMAFSFQMDEDVTIPKTVDVNFDKDTVLKCGNSSVPATGNSPLLGWALNERASENTPGFRLRQHVRCFINGSAVEGGGDQGGGCCNNLPLLVQTIQYSVDIGLLAVGTNKGLAVIDTESNTVLHILSSLTSLLYMTNPSKFTRQVTRESTMLGGLHQTRPTIQRHSTSWSLSHSASASTLHQVTSPMKKPTSVRTPTGREGLGVGDTSQLSSGATEEEYAVVDCESSVTALEMVQLRMDKHAPPTLTLWVGTASGHTVTYGIRVKDTVAGEEGEGRGSVRGAKSKNCKKRTVQLMPTGLILENKYPIVTMQFLNEWGDRQVVPYHLPHKSSMRVDEGRRRSQVGAGSPGGATPTGSASKKENYIIIVDERKIKSYLFPGMTVINRATGPTETTTLLSCQYFLCRDLPCLLTLTSSHHILVHSLPGLKPVFSHHYTPLLNQRIMSTFRVSGDGQALFMSSESEIQRLCICREDRLNLPGCLPQFYVRGPDPLPVSKGKKDWFFGSAPVEMDRSSVFGVGAGQPLMSIAKRDGMSGPGSHQSTRSQRATVNGRERAAMMGGRRGEEERGRGREREERQRGNQEERGRGRESEREERGRGNRGSVEERKERRREPTGLSGQMNRNREALEERKQALTELEEKTEILAGDADDFATLAAKLANKNKARAR